MAEELLKEILVSVTQVDGQEITAATPLASILGGSLGRARLDAEIRARLGKSNPAIYTASTYGELLNALFGESSSPPDVPEVRGPVPPVLSSGNGLAIGIDVECVSALPVAADYWENEFYRRTFTSQEIAYALLQDHPRVSLTATWCAKEAVRKVHAHLNNVDWARIEVVHASDGKPSLELDGVPLQGSLSLSHTQEIAIAAFVSPPPTPPVSAVLPALPEATTSEPKSSGTVKAISWLALILALASIAIQFFLR